MLRLVWSVLMLTVFWALPAHAQQDFLPVEQAFQLNVTKQADGQVGLNWTISKGYYLYRQQMKVEGDPVGSAQPAQWPAGTRKTDETYGESEVYHDQVSVLVNATDARALTIGWQGCADAGLCYPPQSRHVNLADVTATPEASTGLAAANVSQSALATLGEDQDLADRLSRISLDWMLVVFFGLGLHRTRRPR